MTTDAVQLARAKTAVRDGGSLSPGGSRWGVPSEPAGGLDSMTNTGLVNTGFSRVRQPAA